MPRGKTFVFVVGTIMILFLSTVCSSTPAVGENARGAAPAKSVVLLTCEVQEEISWAGVESLAETASIQRVSLDILDDGREPLGDWWSATIASNPGSRPMHKPGSDIVRDAPKKPGQMMGGEVEIAGPMVSSRSPIMDLLTKPPKGKRESLEDMKLELMDVNSTPLMSFDLKECVPESYSPPSVSEDGNAAPGEEQFNVKEVVIGFIFQPAHSNASSEYTVEILGLGAYKGDRYEPTDFSLSGGGLTFEKEDVTPPGRTREYVMTNVSWQKIVIERNYTENDRTWVEWFENLGEGRQDLKDITLKYADDRGGLARTFNYFDCFPVRYDVINVDSRSGSSSVKEVMELVVDRAEYK